MELQLEQLVAAFKGVRSMEELTALAARFSLVADAGKHSTESQILGIYGGRVNGREVRMTHRWHDPSVADVIHPDVNKVKLEVTGRRASDIEFPT